VGDGSIEISDDKTDMINKRKHRLLASDDLHDAPIIPRLW
jgi:hypothetical protein